MLCAPAGRAASVQESAPRFIGIENCKSSSCHGGGVDRNQTTIWQRKDVHTKAHDFLASERSKRMAEALGIADATRSARCTVCHSPMEALPASRLAPKAKIERGVACETCHGPAERWVLSHTRKDVTRDQCIAMGMRPAHDFYQRANICIACHQNIEPELLAAGHPEMFFELDGQMAKEPPHWKDEGSWLGPRAWLTGQAAALRELSWKLTQKTEPNLVARWKALAWLLHKTETGASLPQGDDFAAMQAGADRLARTASRGEWSKDSTLRLLKNYAGLADEFRDGKIEAADSRRRGEVLVLAIDRLWAALKSEAKLSSENFDKALAVLAGEAKAQAGFDAGRFAGALQSLEAAFELMSKG
jgi:hypothetical protein